MLKKRIKFINFNDEEVEQDFYFHWSLEDIVDKQDSNDALQARVQNMVASKNTTGILAELKELIKSSIGRRTEDGNRFIKDEDARSALLDSPAYDALLLELMTDESVCAQFVAGLIPKKMGEKLHAQLEKTGGVVDVKLPETQEDTRPAWVKEDRYPNHDELRGMKPDAVREAFARRLGTKQ